MVFLLDANGVPSVGKFIQIAGDVAPPPDSVTVVEPNGGDLLSPGTTSHISWGLTGKVSAVDVDFSPDGGTSWTPLASNLPIDPPHYEWTVPADPTTKALVRVRKAGSTDVTDQSDAPFTIGFSWAGIPFGSTWKYRDDGKDPGADWMQPGYDDSAWKQGAGELGYGDGDETTQLAITNPAQTSVYFRHTLSLDGTPTAATMKIKFDDGFAVWVNGTPVAQQNVDRGLAHDVYASATAENVTVSTSVPPELLRAGDNVVAVMVKQLGPTSNDLSFDLELDVIGGPAGDGGSGGTGQDRNPVSSSDGGCACTGAGAGGSAVWTLGLVLLGLRRRRRR
jgi:MYXO-CTERM domain-containing protein